MGQEVAGVNGISPFQGCTSTGSGSLRANHQMRGSDTKGAYRCRQMVSGRPAGCLTHDQLAWQFLGNDYPPTRGVIGIERLGDWSPGEMAIMKPGGRW